MWSRQISTRELQKERFQGGPGLTRGQLLLGFSNTKGFLYVIGES